MKTSIILTSLLSIPATVAHAQTAMCMRVMSQNIIQAPNHFNNLAAVCWTVGPAVLFNAANRLYKVVKFEKLNPSYAAMKRREMFYVFGSFLVVATPIIYTCLGYR